MARKPIKSENQNSVPLPERNQATTGRARCGENRGERDITSGQKHHDPEREHDDADQRQQRNQHAEAGGDALAALEGEPGREIVTKDAAHRRGDGARDRPGPGKIDRPASTDTIPFSASQAKTK